MGPHPTASASPRALILWGALIAAAGLAWTTLSDGITMALPRSRRLASASRGSPDSLSTMDERGAVAGVITAANGISYVLAPTIAEVSLYGLNHDLPFAAFAMLVLQLAAFGRSRL